MWWLGSTGLAADWPQWRGGAQHAGSTTQELPATLSLIWKRELPPTRRAWPEQPKLDFDRVYEPIVVGDQLIVGSPVHDAVVSYDTRSGAPRWHFWADGPFRVPVCSDGQRVFAACDDGYLYCLNIADGQLIWKFRGGPDARRVLGNGRLVSTWPARGGPVVDGGAVYFAASIWPFMGIFVHALDAETGAVVWTNDGEGSRYQLQPHDSNSFAGVAPQGSLTLAGETLLVPGGRSVPAAFDRRSGAFRYYELAENGKRGGGWQVAATDQVFFNGGHAFLAETGDPLAGVAWPTVFDGARLVGYHPLRDEYEAFDLSAATLESSERKDRRGNLVAHHSWKLPPAWQAKLPGGSDLILAGNRLIAADANRIVAIAPAVGEQPAEIAWQTTVDGEIARLLAADDRLWAVTVEGTLYCFAAEAIESPATHVGLLGSPETTRDASRELELLLARFPASAGHVVLWEPPAGATLAGATLEQRAASEGLTLAFHADEALVNQRREAAGTRYGLDCTVHAGTPQSAGLPPYFASGMIAWSGAVDLFDAATLRALYEPLRPFGGTLIALGLADDAAHQRLTEAVASAGLENAACRRDGEISLIVREGPLLGSANWTHEHADAANTRVSRDDRVRAPLGLLWFGGPSNHDVLPRHGHGPQPQVLDGRVIVEGMDMLRATDAYTGRLLWKRELPGLGRLYDNLAHQSGANGTNTNFVSMPDGIYVAYDEHCLRLDPATGATLAEFSLPAPPAAPVAKSVAAAEPPAEQPTIEASQEGAKKGAASDKTPEQPPAEPEPPPSPRWGYLNVEGDYLIGGAEPLLAAVAKDNQPAKGTNENFTASKRLVVMNRHSGEVLWTASATHYFRHNAICAGGGRLYAVDLLTEGQRKRLKRRGEEPTGGSRVVAWDLASGSQIWECSDAAFGTYLSYSAEHDVLVEAGRAARDTLGDEAHEMRAFRAASGEVLWREKHEGPAMLLGERVLAGSKACHLLTGQPVLRPDPLSGVETPWSWRRNYGCNTPMASRHLLTFRSGAAGYFDLTGDGGTGNLGGFRSGCTNNLIVAGGILSAPDYTRSCTCSYQNQTSLAFVHMPSAEMWTELPLTKGVVIQRLGLNLGAPGARRAPDGLLWLAEHEQAEVVHDGPGFYSRHPSVVADSELSWIYSSGCRGIQKLAVRLRPEGDPSTAEPPARFRVRLLFCDPDFAEPGRRRFDASIQGEPALTGLDVAAEAGGQFRPLVKQFDGVLIGDRLEIAFTPQATETGAPAILCGLEVVREQ